MSRSDLFFHYGCSRPLCDVGKVPHFAPERIGFRGLHLDPVRTKKGAAGKAAAHSVEIINLQRGTAAATELGGDRQMHQLSSECLILDQTGDFIVQCSYAAAALVSLSMSAAN